MRTNFPQESGGSIDSRADSAQNLARFESRRNGKCPKKIKRRGHVLATIYVKKKNYPFHRLAYRVNGQRLMMHFRTCSEANQQAKKPVKGLAKWSGS